MMRTWRLFVVALLFTPILLHQFDHGVGMLSNAGVADVQPRMDDRIRDTFGEKATFWWHDLIVLDGTVLLLLLTTWAAPRLVQKDKGL